MDRRQLKSNAKFVLKKHYIILFIVSLILALIGGNTGGNVGWEKRFNSKHDSNISSDISRAVNEFSHGMGERGQSIVNHGSKMLQRSFDGLPIGKIAMLFVGAGVAFFSLIILLAAIAFGLFVAFPLRVGGSRIFIESADGVHAPKLGRFAFAFTSGYYMNTMVAGLLTKLYTFLWSLLFVIPGIVKGYAYSMVPYILADNPSLSATEAINLSKEMTRGHKMELFILDISFIGWYILGAFAFGIGVFFVHPYKDATWAQAYLRLREGFLAPPPAADTFFDAREVNGN